MKQFNFYVKGITENNPVKEKRPFSENGIIDAFNFNHALSHVFNLCKEKKVNITHLTISQNV